MFKLLYLLVFNVSECIFSPFVRGLFQYNTVNGVNTELDRICKSKQRSLRYYFFHTQANCISASLHVAEFSLR